MSWIELHPDLTRAANALERIASSLEQIVEFQADPQAAKLHRLARSAPRPALDPREQYRPSTDEELCRIQEEEDKALQRSQGLPTEDEETEE
jgi:hypothetical protein